MTSLIVSDISVCINVLDPVNATARFFSSFQKSYIFPFFSQPYILLPSIPSEAFLVLPLPKFYRNS